MTGRLAATLLAMLLLLLVVLAVAAEQASSRAGAGGVEGSVGQTAEARRGAIGDTGQEVGLTAPARETDAQRVVNAITHEFGSGQVGACFWRIAARESGLNPHAVNLADHHADGSRGSFGALMIGALWRRPGETVDHFRARMMDPAENARLAHRIYERYGLQPWGNRC